jgi:phosphoglycerate dehydrogenase-like enzyme
MAEFTLMSILALGRRLPGIMADRAKKRWAEDRFERFRPAELRGSTVGLIGYGSIGREVARLCKAFGAQVLATKRDLMRPEDDGYVLDGLGDGRAELVDRLYPPQALGSMVALCDFVVVAVPLTPDTRGVIGKAVLARMKPTAFLIDVSRGGVVDHGALIEALNEKRLAGAALDVYPLEPLPESSPLWEMPGVIVSPHIAGASGQYYERAADLFAENLQRYLTGRPLLNRYDPARGY